MKRWAVLGPALIAWAASAHVALSQSPRNYVVVDTGQRGCYDNIREIRCPQKDQPFYGQDAQYQGPQPAYKENGDGTVTDLNTGLMWVKARGAKVTFEQAASGASACRVGGYTDWRMPTIKELYSLIKFNGGFHPEGNSVPYIDTAHFDFKYGDRNVGERPIDCQDWSATQYIGSTGLTSAVFGVNFADGRIKSYPKEFPGGVGKRPGMGLGPPPPPGMGPDEHGRRPHRSAMGPGGPAGRPGIGPSPPPSPRGMRHGRPGGIHRMYVRYVRGNPAYGVNKFEDNGDGTVTDEATGLMWSKADSRKGMNWEAALRWVHERNSENYLGHSDWRLPDAKELQSIVAYSRAPDAPDTERQGPAIDPIFHVTRLNDGKYPWFWTSTTHLDGPVRRMGRNAVYVAFGEALGYLRRPPTAPLRLFDVHGAGAQRSDPKAGNPSDYPRGRGPQGDVIRIDNFVRCVRTMP